MTRVITIPNGRQVTLAAYVEAIHTVKANPDAEYKGWEWYAVKGRTVLHRFFDMVQDHCNRGLTIREDRRLHKRWLAAMQRTGRSCKWCGQTFTPETVNDRCCCPSCYRDYNS